MRSISPLFGFAAIFLYLVPFYDQPVAAQTTIVDMNLKTSSPRFELPLLVDKGAFTSKFEKVWETVRTEFYDAKLHNVDWNKIKDQYRERLKVVNSNAEFEFLMNDMLAELKASHMAYVTTDDMEYYMLSSVREQEFRRYALAQIGIMGQRLVDGYHVAGILNGGPAEKAGIQSGDILITANGKPFLSAFSFRGKEGSPVNVMLKRLGEAASRSVTVVPKKENMLQAFLDATSNSARIINVDGKEFGYIHLWTMAAEPFRQTLEHLVETKLHATDGLILDLRDGYGGQPFGFSDVFFRPDVSWEMELPGKPIETSHTGYGRPIVVLINGGTRSAKEFLTYQLKSTHRATVVGSRTAGAFLGAGFIPIGDDGILELAIEGLKVDTVLLEKNGVKPDIEVDPQFTYTDRDVQLLKAEQVLSQIAPKRKATPGDPVIIHAN